MSRGPAQNTVPKNQPRTDPKKPSYNRKLDNDEFLSTAKAAQHIGVSPNTLRRYVKDHGIPRYKLSARLVKFKRSDLDAFLEARSSARYTA